MKYLIVNGDDLGASPGVSRGILEAHRQGVLTSASLMVHMPASDEASALARTAPNLSVGLHVELDIAARQPTAHPAGCSHCRSALHRQLGRFRALVGRPPTHLDSHHNVHRLPWLLPLFLEVAQQHGLPLRSHSPINCVSGFYGQWGGETHPEQVSVEGLTRILATEIQSGVTELSCHPGYAESDFPSTYRAEREVELRTLCAPAVHEALRREGIQLINFRTARALVRRDA
jgi:predicted glycoside hydrolase/deacetylase ChbG (UPF0249 family)